MILNLKIGYSLKKRRLARKSYVHNKALTKMITDFANYVDHGSLKLVGITVRKSFYKSLFGFPLK